MNKNFVIFKNPYLRYRKEEFGGVVKLKLKTLIINKQQYKLIEKIRNELNCGIVLISHDLHVVMSSTDRVICLNGHVCCSGTPAVVATEPEFRTLFGDRAANELAFYKHHHDHEHLADQTVRKTKEVKPNASAQLGRKDTSHVSVKRNV